METLSSQSTTEQLPLFDRQPYTISLIDVWQLCRLGSEAAQERFKANLDSHFRFASYELRWLMYQIVTALSGPSCYFYQATERNRQAYALDNRQTWHKLHVEYQAVDTQERWRHFAHFSWLLQELGSQLRSQCHGAQNAQRILSEEFQTSLVTRDATISEETLIAQFKHLEYVNVYLGHAQRLLTQQQELEAVLSHPALMDNNQRLLTRAGLLNLAKQEAVDVGAILQDLSQRFFHNYHAADHYNLATGTAVRWFNRLVQLEMQASDCDRHQARATVLDQGLGIEVPEQVTS